MLQPYPTRFDWSRWLLVPYLFLAGVQGTALAGVLTFSHRVLYPNYAATPNIWGINPLTDQSLAGAIMWVPMSLAFLFALVWVVGQQFTGQRVTPIPSRQHHSNRAARRQAFRVPRKGWRDRGQAGESILGLLLKRRVVRRFFRLTLLVLAIVVIVDGLTGPQVSPINLAGVLPWIHWRGLLVLVLLFGGNFFCMACPFTSFRPLARKLFAPDRHWPKRLQNKWLAIGMLVGFFWAYEAFALWDRPFWTAVIAVGFFLVAFVFDVTFVEAPFCKFVCPIGQFNFVQSLVSPTEITIRNSQVCSGCRTKDCITGNDYSSGCQTSLFQPQKLGNMDCTFCFDCVEACPHDNVALVAIGRGAHLADDRRRSGIGRFGERFDLAAIIVLLFFAAFVNAAWMTAPVIELERSLVDWTGFGRLPLMTIGMLLALGVSPLILVSTTAWLSGRGEKGQLTIQANIAAFAPALIPLGMGMWLAHYSFHLFTSADSILIAANRAWSDWNGAETSISRVACACCTADSISWLLPLELGFLGLGLCLSFVTAYRISLREASDQRFAIRSLSPWCLLMILFYVSCVWVLLQPMQMRGSLMVGM